MNLNKTNFIQLVRRRLAWRKLLICLLPITILTLLLVSGAEATSLNDATFKPLGDLSIPQIIGKAIALLLGISGVLALIMFVYGGVIWMTAQGNTEQVAKAQKTIIWSVLGLVAIFSSYAIISLVLGLLSQT
ncbi:pilin [Patescibacteria group bacterium]|nr:pilin [Patescibacteria group bacterium]MBU1029298.1 pilin [Patescibacteria group bacterium]MBU1916466.1 pilin [Patescibacteria group bacterium]